MVIEPARTASVPAGLKARVAVFKALADTSRLQVVSALLERPHCAEELAERLRRAPSTISFHLRKLDEAGLVTKTKTQYYLVYELRSDLLAMTLGELVSARSPAEAPDRRRLDRYREKVLRTFFRDGALTQLPKQWRKRRIVLEPFVAKLQPGRRYQEHEVNARIETLYADYCTIRRMLIDEGYMARDGSAYWLTDGTDQTRESADNDDGSADPTGNENGNTTMDTRRELKRRYRETPKDAGIFQVKNTVDGKILLGSSTNLHGPLNKHRFLLSIGKHMNPELQADWNRLGPGAFTFEVLDVVKRKDTPEFSLDDELTLLEQIWLEKLQPYPPRGYTKDARIRE